MGLGMNLRSNQYQLEMDTLIVPIINIKYVRILFNLAIVTLYLSLLRRK